MAVINRALDSSQQRVVFQTQAGATATGISQVICVVPWPCTLDAGEISAFGLSGSPTYALAINRFVVGSGNTAITIAVGTSNVPSAYGTSGPFSMVLPAAGSTLLSLQANDVVFFQTGASNTAVTGVCVSLVLKPIQDIKVHHGQL